MSNFPYDNEIKFSKFYGKVGVISWFLFHLIWKNYILYWDFDLKSWIVDFFTRFTREKTPQNNFSSQNFSVENNYFILNIKSGTTSYSSNWNVVILSYCRWPGMNYSNVRMDSSDGLNFFFWSSLAFLSKEYVYVFFAFLLFWHMKIRGK